MSHTKTCIHRLKVSYIVQITEVGQLGDGLLNRLLQCLHGSALLIVLKCSG